MVETTPFPDVLQRRPHYAQPVTAAYVRDLEEKDILEVFSVPAKNGVRPLKKVGAAHHNIAKLMAQGMSHVEISAIMNRSPGAISNLTRDPAFQELVAHYTEIKDEIFADVHQQMASVGLTALARLQESLEDEDTPFEPDQLRKIVETTMDRTGHGPSKTIHKVNNVDFIKKLVEEAQAERRGEVRKKAI